MVLFLMVLLYPLSLRERVRERGSNESKMLYLYPLILSSSLEEKERTVKIVLLHFRRLHYPKLT
jgi:hypothetical protein